MKLLIYSGTLIGISYIVGNVSFAVFSSFSKLELLPTFTAGNILQASSTLTASVIVAYFLQRYTQTKRKEKDIFLDQIGDLIDEMSKIEELENSTPLTAITGAIKRISLRSRNIKELLTELKFSKEMIESMDVDARIKELRELCTDTPIEKIENHARGPKCSIEVRQGIIQLAEGRRQLVVNSACALKLHFQKIQLRINRY